MRKKVCGDLNADVRSTSQCWCWMVGIDVMRVSSDCLG